MRVILVTAAALFGAAILAPRAGAVQQAPAAAERLTLPGPKAGHARPLVVVVAENAGAEITDFTVPYGVLKESGLFEVRAVSTGAGPIQLQRSMKVLPDQTLAQFEATTPEGADIVIVPAQMDPKDRALLAWVKTQADRGATIVSICEGARVLARAGLLHDKHATSHWSALKSLEKSFPDTTWVRDRRYVQDGRIISTTGVSASIPVSIALIEAAGGRPAAQSVAARIGVDDWSPLHRTADFQVTRVDYVRAATSLVAPWTHEAVEIPVRAGEDEVALALRADAWTRTFRTRVVLTNPGGQSVRSLHGLAIVPDDRPRHGRYIVPARAGAPAHQLDATLEDMRHRYGAHPVRLARLGMEYASLPSAN